MLIRYLLTVSTPIARANDEMELKLGTKNEVTVKVSQDVLDERLTSIVATCQVSPSAANLETFKQVARGILPKGSKPYKTLSFTVQPGKSLQKHIPPLSIMPQPFKSYVEQEDSKLRRAAKDTYKLMRWRYGVGGKHAPFSTRGLEFSLDDGKAWHKAPSNVRGSIHLEPALHLGSYNKEAIEEMLKLEKEEPVSEELLLEAQQLYYERNYRSALIVAVTALEVGVKRCISLFAPSTDWLMKEVASPPVKKLLAEYLPILTPPPDGRQFPNLPGDTLKRIEAFVHKRNSLVHSYQTVNLTSEFTEEAIDTIRDILWILEGCTGHSWAFDHISDDMWEKLPWSQNEKRADNFTGDGTTIVLSKGAV